MLIILMRLFPLWESMGFHITPNHFYQPVPDTRTLKPKLWLQQSELFGINMNEQEQIQLLNQFLRFREEYETLLKRKELEINDMFGPVDIEILYCMIRYFKPKKIIEIGSGFSTYISSQAILKNEEENGNKTELIAIEPYPSDFLMSGFPGLSKVIPKKVEEIDLTFFTGLKENDILFVDSSHVLKMGNDVVYEYLEILPRLNKGVIVHIHDIFLPCEYPEKWVLEMHRFWNEQYLLQAFLTFNSAFEILWAGAYMHLKHPDILEKTFNSYNRKMVWSFPLAGATSFYIRKKNYLNDGDINGNKKR